MNKEKYCRRILDVYGLLVDFDGDVGRSNVPGPIDKNETAKSWIKRVLGSNVNDVIFYVPFDYYGQTRINSIKSDSTEAAKYVRNMLNKTLSTKTQSFKDEIASYEVKLNTVDSNHKKSMEKIKSKHNVELGVSYDYERVEDVINSLSLCDKSKELFSTISSTEKSPERIVTKLLQALNYRIEELDKRPISS